MPLQKHCPGCFQDKSSLPVCPACGYDELAPRSALFLPHGLILAEQYRIGKVLGKPGGFGITYLGWDVNLQQRVAIKEYLPREIAGRQEGSLNVHAHTEGDRQTFEYGREQFLQEARIAARFDHPNIVSVRGFCKAHGTAYLIMDYYEGLSLGDYLSSRSATIAADVAAGVLSPILDGLEYVHERGVVHRDVKPANVYLAAIGKPILLDFGAARHAASDGVASMSVVMTEGYAPLEQYQRRAVQGPWTDVYGAAATLLRMITGHAPPAALDRMGHDPLEVQDMPGVPPALRAILLRALAVQPPNRYQTVGEFRAALQAWREKPDSAPPTPPLAVAPGPPAENEPTTRKLEREPETRPRLEPPTKPAPERPLPPPPAARALPPMPAGPAVPAAAGSGLDRPVTAAPPADAARAPAGSPPGTARRRVPGQRLTFSIGFKQTLASLLAVAAILAALWVSREEPVPYAPAQAPRKPAVQSPRPEPEPAAAPAPPAAASGPLLEPDLVHLPAAEFVIGDDQGPANQRPAHAVKLAAFSISATEITVEQFAQFVERSGYSNPRWGNYPCESAGGRFPEWNEPGYSQDGRFPVVCVNWADARAYAQWLSRETGGRWRLPTEAEWEYAARAGTQTPFWWGEQPQHGSANCAGCQPARNAPERVRAYPANPFGVYETSGNVREWTCSAYGLYGGGAEQTCSELGQGAMAAVRGGSWQEPPSLLRSAARSSFEPFRRNVWTGFRLVREAD